MGIYFFVIIIYKCFINGNSMKKIYGVVICFFCQFFNAFSSQNDSLSQERSAFKTPLVIKIDQTYLSPEDELKIQDEQYTLKTDDELKEKVILEEVNDFLAGIEQECIECLYVLEQSDLVNGFLLRLRAPNNPPNLTIEDVLDEKVKD